MGVKYCGLMLDSTKAATDCFVLEFSTADKIQNRICISSIIMTLDNSKFEEGQDYY